MLHRARTGELVGCGERVTSRYGEEVVVSKWNVRPRRKNFRKQTGVVPDYDVEVIGYTVDEHRNQISGYESYTLFELQLEWHADVRPFRAS